MSRRVDINARVALSSSDFRRKVVRALNTISVVNECNFDLRSTGDERGYKYLTNTIDVAKQAKSLCILTKKSLEDLIFNLDHFILKNSEDKKRVQERANGRKSDT